MKKEKTLPTSMTPELWALYRLIEKNTNEGKTLKIEDICRAFPDRYHLITSQSNYSNCKVLYEDIYLINTEYMYEHDKYIITNNNNIKLATEAEIQREFRKVAKQFKRLNAKRKALKKVIKTNGQYKLLSNQNVPISEKTNAKPYIESYAKQ